MNDTPTTKTDATRDSDGAPYERLADPDAVRRLVRERYGQIADTQSSCCGGGGRVMKHTVANQQAKQIGYTDDDLSLAPVESNLGLGCGNPTALTELREGDTVVDLGAGAGLDAFIAARAVGPSGRVIGVDMTPSMLAKARENAVRAGLAANVEFREGTIEALPVVDRSVDVVISNCVINLSPDKPAAFGEAYRILKPGGRLAVSDIVLTEPLPEELRASADLFVGCVAGAMLGDDYVRAIANAGFVDIDVQKQSAGPMLLPFLDDPTYGDTVATVGRERITRAANSVFSYRITARKP